MQDYITTEYNIFLQSILNSIPDQSFSAFGVVEAQPGSMDLVELLNAFVGTSAS